VGRLFISTAMTVDGLVDVTGWYVPEGGHDRAGLEELDRAEAMLLGRKTYEGLAGYWPSAEGDWADLINPMPKYVVSRTLDGPLEWNATLLAGEAAETVPRLKEQLDGDLFMSGCGELGRALLELGLVDELLFWVHPALSGPGTRPFGENRTIRLRLMESTAFDSGVVLLRYEPLPAG
jgi:dihydrofolate reductase